MLSLRVLKVLRAFPLFLAACGGAKEPSVDEINELSNEVSISIENKTVSLAEDSTLEISLEATAKPASAGEITYSIAKPPIHGTLAGSDGKYTYTPEPDFNGADEATITAEIGGESASATIAITVTPVNDVPFFLAGPNVSADEDAGPQAVAWATKIAAGPQDEQEAVSFSVENDNTELFALQPFIDSSGTLHFTSVTDANGVANVTVTLSDGELTSKEATFAITVTPINDPPYFTAGNDVDVDEDAGPQSIIWATGIAPGPLNEFEAVSFSVSNDSNWLFLVQPYIDASGTLQFTAVTDANGVANIVVSLSDGGLSSKEEAFVLTIFPVNDAPSFTPGGSVSVPEDSGPKTVVGWATDISPGALDESGQSLAFSVSNDNNGLFLVQPVVDGSGTLHFTPAPDANGVANVSVKLSDGELTKAADPFAITVTPQNDPPYFTAGEGVSVDEDAGPQSIVWATGISAGPPDELEPISFSVTNDNPSLFLVQPYIDDSGTLHYTAVTDASGAATVTVSLSDGDLVSEEATFTITLNPVNDTPSFTAGADQTVLEDSGLQTVVGWATNISAGPADEAGQSLVFIVSNDNASLFSLQPTVTTNGTLSFTPAAKTFGIATVSVAITDNGDGANTSATHSFQIIITNINDSPSYTPGAPTVTINEDSGQYAQAWATNVSAGTNEAGQALSFSLTLSGADQAKFASQPTMSSTGVLYFVPGANVFGSATVRVILSDDGGTANAGKTPLLSSLSRSRSTR